jgi:segregation and condensation protein B
MGEQHGGRPVSDLHAERGTSEADSALSEPVAEGEQRGGRPVSDLHAERGTSEADSALSEPVAGADVEPDETARKEDVTDDELVAVAQSDPRPDVLDDAVLESALEALLLVVDSPASEESLAEAVEQPVHRVTEMLGSMATRFTERGSGIDLRRIGEGWRFYTRDSYAPFVEKLLLDGQRSKLTRAALETLAVIAYRQPVTRARVAAVRGVNVDGVIRTLLARGLIEETGTDAETGGTLYITTELFLERLGLSSLTDLPPIAPLLPEVDSIDDI